MKHIYLIPPHGVKVYGKHLREGVYGESHFTVDQMCKLIELKCAEWFDVSSPHMQEVKNKRPCDYIGHVYTILSRAEIWGIDWFIDEGIKDEIRTLYPLLSPVFERVDKRE